MPVLTLFLWYNKGMEIKPKKSYRVKGTMRQRAAIQKIIENHGNVSLSMREVGYPETTASVPGNLTESKAYKQALPSLVERLQTEIDRAISLMPQKSKKAKYRDMVDAVDKLNKNKQLLQGGVTDRGELTFKWQGAESADRKAVEQAPDEEKPRDLPVT